MDIVALQSTFPIFVVFVVACIWTDASFFTLAEEIKAVEMEHAAKEPCVIKPALLQFAILFIFECDEWFTFDENKVIFSQFKNDIALWFTFDKAEINGPQWTLASVFLVTSDEAVSVVEPDSIETEPCATKPLVLKYGLLFIFVEAAWFVLAVIKLLALDLNDEIALQIMFGIEEIWFVQLIWLNVVFVTLAEAISVVDPVSIDEELCVTNAFIVNKECKFKLHWALWLTIPVLDVSDAETETAFPS